MSSLTFYENKFKEYKEKADKLIEMKARAKKMYEQYRKLIKEIPRLNQEIINSLREV